MEKQIGDFTVSIDALAAPLPLIPGIHSGQCEKSFPKGRHYPLDCWAFGPFTPFPVCVGEGGAGVGGASQGSC